MYGKSKATQLDKAPKPSDCIPHRYTDFLIIRYHLHSCSIVGVVLCFSPCLLVRVFVCNTVAKINFVFICLRLYICVTKAENMTHTINISANFTATVTVSDSCVVITTNYFNTKRSSSFDSVADAIKNTSIPAVAKLLSSI